MLPSGFRVKLQKQLAGTAWRLVGSRPRGTLCHKPCTVSGGGKSEISKSIRDVLLKGPVFVKDYHRDMDQVAEIFDQDFSDDLPEPAARRTLPAPDSEPGAFARVRHPDADAVAGIHRRAQRLGEPAFADHAAAGLHRQALLPARVGRQLARAFHGGPDQRLPGPRTEIRQPETGRATICASATIRDGSWRIYKLRPDFYPAEKVQMEDDITASVVLPRERAERSRSVSTTIPASSW